jgi:hypothetical protein
MRRVIHVGIAKPLLLSLLHAHGAGEVLRGWTGTDAEAAAVIEADPRDFFVLSDECQHQKPDGSCDCWT